MTRRSEYPQEPEDFDRIRRELGCVMDVDRRLPDWPFMAPHGHADICQFSVAVGGEFGAVLEALVAAHGDESVSLAVLEPRPEYYREN